MKEVWSLPSLQDWIQQERPTNVFALELTGSLSRSSQIFGYHMRHARDAFAGFQDADNNRMTLAILGGADEDEHLAFKQAILASEANLIAAINAVRNSYDIFAQLVNTLVLVVPMDVSACTIHNVAQKLDPSPLKTELDQTLTSNWYNYLSDFTNTIKHRQLLKHDPSVSFIQGKSGGKVEQFVFEKPPSKAAAQRGDPGVTRNHPAYWVSDVLQGLIEVHNAMSDCGREINRLLIQPKISHV